MSDQNSYRSVMRLLPGDEKRIHLANQGVLFLDDELDDSTFHVLNLNLMYMASTSTSSPIWIFLNSPGGSVAQGFGIYDSIRMVANTGKTVNIVGIGHVASMATAIMQAATRRFSTPLTQFLVHQIRQTIIDTEEVNQSKERVEEAERLNDIVMSLIADRAGVDLAELKELSRKKDFWLDPVKAKHFGKNGLIDEIITKLPF